MAWTAPVTVTSNQNISASVWNAQIPSNFAETDQATAATAGDLIYADAANSMGSRLGVGPAGTVLATTGSAPVWRAVVGLGGDPGYVAMVGTGMAFTDIGIGGAGLFEGRPVEVTVTTGTRALVYFGARSVAVSKAGDSLGLSYRISGATTVGTTGLYALNESGAANDAHNAFRVNLETGLTAGVNTFTLQGQINVAATPPDAQGTISRPFIIVQAL